MENPDEHVAALAVIAETNLEALAIQRSGIERLETKAVVLLGLTVTASQLTLLARDMILGWRVAALVAFALAFVFCLVAVAPFTYTDLLSPDVLYNKYRERPVGEVQSVLAATRAIAYKKNLKIANKKSRAWKRSLVLLVLGILLAGMASLGGETDERHRGQHTHE